MRGFTWRGGALHADAVAVADIARDADRIAAVFDAWGDRPGVELAGLHVHIGSPVPRPEP